ncbi:hypothetical protein [Hyphomonas sp. CACIAM 19H1]|uniref:hypothetical protein n=1 Tax=Hyphomonas sp. CACIAM 19H1 TaxID=1873716 RepID=UPI0013B06D3F|nr:hypothetical protein [Hyphomonas sp. CACIAM 19H1]
MVILTNYGNQTILVKSLWVFGFKGLLGKTLGKREWSGFVFNSGLHPLPFKLEPASEWQGLVVQNDVLNASIAKGLAFVGIAHSHASKPLLVKIQKAIEAPEEKTP